MATASSRRLVRSMEDSAANVGRSELVQGLPRAATASAAVFKALETGDWRKVLHRWRKRLPSVRQRTSDAASRSLQDITILSDPLWPSGAESAAASYAGLADWLRRWIVPGDAPPPRVEDLAEFFTPPVAPSVATPLPEDASASRSGRSSRSRKASARVELPGRDDPDSADIWEALLLCDLLLFASDDWPDDLLWAAWWRGWRMMEALSSPGDDSEAVEAGDVEAARWGELMWKASLLYEELAPAAEWQVSGRKQLSGFLRSMTDEQGRPEGESLESLTGTLALLVRSAVWAENFSAELFDAEDAERFLGWTRSAVVLTRADGRFAFDPVLTAPATGSDRTPLALLDRALRVAGWGGKSRPRLAVEALSSWLSDGPPNERGPEGRRKADRKLTSVTKEHGRPSFQSDDALVACLRGDWSPDADRLAVAHHQPQTRISLSLQGQLFVLGTWALSLEVNGRPVKWTHAWSPTCWFSDEDVDYLEIQQQFDDGMHIERQMLLSRRHRLLMMADCIAQSRGPIQYRATLPLAGGVRAVADEPTRELRLSTQDVSARVFPVALPDDRLRSATGDVRLVDGRLEYQQSGEKGLFAPLVFDWDPDRQDAPADWRTLTVTEDGRALPRGIASGHRLRVGKHQLMMYRAIERGEGLRAVLGYQTGHETVVGLFGKTGDIDPLLLVE